MKQVINFILAVSFIGLVSACGGSRQEVQSVEEVADSTVTAIDSTVVAVSDTLAVATDSVEAVIDSVKTEE